MSWRRDACLIRLKREGARLALKSKGGGFRLWDSLPLRLKLIAENPAEQSRSAGSIRRVQNRLLMNITAAAGLYRLASASRRRESKMLFRQRNIKDVAVRTQVSRSQSALNFFSC